MTWLNEKGAQKERLTLEIAQLTQKDLKGSRQES